MGRSDQDDDEADEKDADRDGSQQQGEQLLSGHICPPTPPN
ncbi:hypothetical protein [Halopiger goleimassiliensis]|nr:hypothetical protein [Halopiger goleimassiliensis]